MHQQSFDSIPETVKWLAYGPRDVVQSYEGYDVNGYTFWTEQKDDKSISVQNSGVIVVASTTEYASVKDKDPIESKMVYFGRIKDIWELDYSGFKVGLFRCQWVNERRYIKKDDPCGFTLVDMSRLRDTAEPFIFASQAKQVFYVVDPADANWSIVVQGKRRILGVDGVEDEEEYDAFQDSPAFTNPKTVATDVDTSYMRNDHTEGIVEEKID